ncbi:MAG TPA: helix-turn-helix domain-containing protein, partial [Actinomycetota bacterium]|nr:helix-turn-helix domain-containing protein [Actinomycetota bacterium]
MPNHSRSNRRRRRDPEQEEHRTRRRIELLEAADRALRREGPLVSMNAIAAEAGVTKPILYRHFGDKGGLYQAIA